MMNSNSDHRLEQKALNQSNPALATPAVPSWQGHLQLEFAKRQEETILRRSQVKAPLKVQRPFYPEGKAVCHSVILHTAGGVVGGDRLSLDIVLKPEAQTLITTAAAAKIYRSNGAVAQQTIEVAIGEAACLEWLPQETILFNGAIYAQKMRVELASQATWCGWEITRLGRSARGERFSAGEWRSHTEVWQQDRLLWVDPQGLQGGEMLYSPHSLAGYPVIGSFAFIGQTVSAELVEKARLLWQEADFGEASSPERLGEVGVTRLMAGLLCRYRGNSTLEARRWFIQVWYLLRSAYLGRPGCLPRVWQM